MILDMPLSLAEVFAIAVMVVALSIQYIVVFVDLLHPTLHEYETKREVLRDLIPFMILVWFLNMFLLKWRNLK